MITLSLILILIIITFNYHNIRFTNRYNGYYLLYDSKHWNKIDCQYKLITHFIKLISYES